MGPLVYDECLNGHPSLILAGFTFRKVFASNIPILKISFLMSQRVLMAGGVLESDPSCLGGDGDVHPGPTEVPGSHVVGVMGTERTGFVWIVSSAHAFPASCLVLSSQSLSRALLHLGSTQIT